MLRHPKIGTLVKTCVKEFPAIELETQIQPITRTVLRIRLTIIPKFKWHRKVSIEYFYTGVGAMYAVLFSGPWSYW